MTTRPDILFIVLDTQRADRLSCYGYERETTPHLDALAADATLFRHAVSTAQWTVPSHTSMFTGVYPSVHGTQQSDSVVPKSLPTLAERLTAGGYYTAGFCNNPLVGVVNNGLRRGFYSFLNYSGWLTSRPNQAGAHPGWLGIYRQWFKGLLAGTLNRAQDAFARSDLLLRFAFTPIMVPFWQTALSFKGNTAKSLNDAAQLLVERKGVKADQPVFCFLNLMGTHAPYHPRRQFIEKFAPEVLQNRQARRYLRRFNSDIFGWLAPIADPLPLEHKSILDGIYDAEVANQDDQLGDFFAQLRSSGVLDNTLVIICADHGDHLGEKQLIGHSFLLYNELTHVPLIIRDPANNLPRGATVEDVVSTRRLFHTVLTTAGLADAEEQAYSLAQNASSDPDGGVVFAEGEPPQNVLHLVRKNRPRLIEERRYDLPRRAAWDNAHKLIVTGNEQQELYAYHTDPGETQNLRDAAPDKAAALRELLVAFEQETESVAAHAARAANHDDPQVQRRLRALGYLE